MKMQKDPVCGMQIEESKAAGKSVYKGQTSYFCAAACQEKFDTNPTQFIALQTEVGNEWNNKPLVTAFVVVVVLFVIFGGLSMLGAMMNGGMMRPGWNGGFGWMWIPSLLTLGLGILLGWMIFAGKKH